MKYKKLGTFENINEHNPYYYIFPCIFSKIILLNVLQFIASIYIHTQPGALGYVVKQNNIRVRLSVRI